MMNNNFKEERRSLDHMPFDKRFEVDSQGHTELCHATGYEVCFEDDDPMDAANWWNEYEDHEGNVYYGR